MDEKIDMELPLEAPLDMESLPVFFEKIMGYWLIHQHDQKISLLRKVENCAIEFGLSADNIIHVSFIVTTFFNAVIGIEQAKQQFGMIYQSPGKPNGSEVA